MDEDESKSTLESPLIPSSEKGFENCDQRPSKKCVDRAGMVVELKKQMQLAGPLAFVTFLQYSLQMIALMFVGHLDNLSLSSASMATSFAGVTGFSYMLGMGTALETLCGQAHGAKQHDLLGIHMQSAMIVLSISSIPIAILWAYTEQIFTSLHQDSAISFHAGIYAQWLIPSILPYGLLQCQFRFLQTQNNILPLMLSAGVTTLVHVLSCWTSIFRFGLGSKGAALSTAISYWTNVIILAIYIKLSPKCGKTWTGFSKKALKNNLYSFLRLGIPSALMICLESWSYEFLVLLSGLLPNPKLETSVMSISLNISEAVFRVPFGFGSAVSTRVSNELGAGRPDAARLAVLIVIFLALTEGVFLSSIAVAVRRVCGYLFSNDREVIDYMALIMPVLALSNFLDGIQAVLSGVARGCGWQKIGAYVNLGAYFLLGLPCAISLAFAFQFGAEGLWMGITCGSGTQAFVLLVIILRTNWKQEAIKAADRIFSSEISTEMPV